MSPRSAPSLCTHDRCPNIATHKGRCEEHRSSGWTDRPQLGKHRGSARSIEGVSDAAIYQWMKAVEAANPEGICYVCGKPGADEIDHKIPILEGGAATDPANGGRIHGEPCHRRKTARELAAARGRYRGHTY